MEDAGTGRVWKQAACTMVDSFLSRAQQQVTSILRVAYPGVTKPRAGGLKNRKEQVQMGLQMLTQREAMGGVVERDGTCKASAATIWRTCFQHMKFDVWDPDVLRMEDINEDTGLVEGAKATFVMKKESGGGKLPIVCVDVTENERFTFKGSAAGGLMKFEGTIVLKEKGPNATHVQYKFGMKGPLGRIFGTLNAKAVVGGTENGLKNIIELSERASSVN